MKKILVIGATSGIAEAVCQQFAARGDELLLTARNQERLHIIAQDLEVRGATAVHTGYFNALEQDYTDFIQHAHKTLNRLDIVFIAHGTLSNQDECAASNESMLRELQINALSTISLLTEVANLMQQQGSGNIAVITSVAGDRGRQSNYIYGSAKAMVIAFLQGLRHRLFKDNIKVLDIRPGFVDTAMTKDFEKGALWATPDQIAPTIINAIDKGKDVIYVPWFWKFIMLIIRNIPEMLFKRTKL